MYFKNQRSNGQKNKERKSTLRNDAYPRDPASRRETVESGRARVSRLDRDRDERFRGGHGERQLGEGAARSGQRRGYGTRTSIHTSLVRARVTCTLAREGRAHERECTEWRENRCRSPDRESDRASESLVHGQ